MTSTTSFAQNLVEFEKRERDLATVLFTSLSWIKEYSFTSGPVFYDGIVTSIENTQAIFEIKCRDFDVYKYPNYFLELSKFQNLYKGSERTGYKLLYINFFKTDKENVWDYIVFNLSRRIEEWKINGAPATERILMNKKTFVSRQDKIYKETIRLSYEHDKDLKGTVLLSNK